jgi:DNA invertase Pin-like site-specific DNA recombinase
MSRSPEGRRPPHPDTPATGSAPEPSPPCGSGGTAKIQAHHRARLAIVYVRQSTPQQVLEHRESTRRQYALADYAVALGWPRERVLVIDEDQGQSGKNADSRAGFQRLLAEVTLDHAGIVLGLEMSRLARSCKDCHQLIEVCAVFRTLLGDQDGLYDANDPNDRLLLGLKGTISEVELHTLRGRLERGRLNKAQRGELFYSVPMGYLLTPAGVEFDPDEQVRDVVRLIFDKFDELGSARAVLGYLLEHDIRLGFRLRRGPRRGQLDWRRPRMSSLLDVLHHPLYAGVYTHGRCTIDPRRKVPGRPSSGRVKVPLNECKVVQHDRVPAYISWQRYVANQQRLTDNLNRPTTPGSPRSGNCLLAGLVVCGRCGYRMQVQYRRDGRPAYRCIWARYEGHKGLGCPPLLAAVLDDTVAACVLAALEPAAVELSLQAVAAMDQEWQRLDRHWQQQLQRTRYEAEEAERRYRLVDAANRLVASTLEQRWEQALRTQRQRQEDYDRWQREKAVELSEQERSRLKSLAANIPALWQAAATTMAQRKEIVRCLVQRVVATVEGDSERVAVAIHWEGGLVSETVACRPVVHYEQRSDYEELNRRIVQWWEEGHSAAVIATRLNAEGWRPLRGGEEFNAGQVRSWLRRGGRSEASRGILEPHGEHWRLRDLARTLPVDRATLRAWVRRGWVQATKHGGQGRWTVWADEAELGRLRQLRAYMQEHPGVAAPAELTSPRKPRKR